MLNSREQTMATTIDLTGLPDPIVRGVQQLVETMRDQLAHQPVTAQPTTDVDARLALLDDWISSRPQSAVVADDSRESIYAGRGE
jgi:hypothetical protein